jgi:site-specific DNA recombinase
MSPKEKPNQPLDVYVRVSRVNGREGDSFQSPEVQEERCRAYATALGLQVGEVFTDLDQSGGKASRPAFDKMMQRIRDGESGGVVVYKLSRFSRRVKDTLAGIAEIESHGAVFACLDPKIDTTTKDGRFTLTLFAALNEMELDGYTEQWATSQDKAFERGACVGPTPVGYARQEDGTLKRNGYRDEIARAFELRAQGARLNGRRVDNLPEGTADVLVTSRGWTAPFPR